MTNEVGKLIEELCSRMKWSQSRGIKQRENDRKELAAGKTLQNLTSYGLVQAWASYMRCALKSGVIVVNELKGRSGHRSSAR